MALNDSERGSRREPRLKVFLFQERQEQMPFLVDEILSEQELLLKDLGHQFKKGTVLMGQSSLLVDSWPCALLVSDLRKTAA